MKKCTHGNKIEECQQCIDEAVKAAGLEKAFAAQREDDIVNRLTEEQLQELADDDDKRE